MKTTYIASILTLMTCLEWAHAKSKLPGPLIEGLGNHHHRVSTDSKVAQRYFDQGLALTYAFNHKEAILAFRSAATVDPGCAMAHWGVALAHGPHVNKSMEADDNVQAWAALQRAIAAKPHATPRERDYIDALAKRYTEAFPTNRATLDRAYADAMRALAKKYPDDTDAQTLFADALMNTMPWDYWLKDRSPKPETQEAFTALRAVLARDPHHPGANHMYIHAVEAGPNPEWGLPSADSLLTFAPAAGHLVHMASHIYMRVGQYDDAVISNQRAVKADESYLKQSRAQGFYPGVYYPHNVHFLWWAQLFQGRSRDALKSATKAAQYAVDNYCGPSKAYEAPRFRHLPWITLARFGKWDDVLAIRMPADTNDFLFDRAIWHFTRGLAFAARSDVEAATREQSALAKVAAGDALRALDNPQLPVSSVVTVASEWLAARVAELRGNKAGAIAHYEKAISTEDAMPYMEPAYWPIPVRPAFGSFLLRTGDAARATTVFREDLQRMPRNAWALLGLEQALRAQQQTDSANDVRREFERTWKSADTRLDLTWF